MLSRDRLGILRNVIDCHLCGGHASVTENAATYFWRDFQYQYARCAECRSLTATPLPGDHILDALYGPDYADMVSEPYQIDSTKDHDWVLDHLSRLERGHFVDYGCGRGELLEKVAALGWEATGVEYSAGAAEAVTRRTGLAVAAASDMHEVKVADVLHCADVVEHLVTPLPTFVAALRLARHDAVIMAQGPLEAGPSLFSGVVRPGIGGGRSEVLPTHLWQATSAGQRRFFQRAGLHEHQFLVSEVDWPAPSRLRRSDLTNPRTIALWGLRRASRAFDALRPTWGNRYRYLSRLDSRNASS